MSHFIDGGNCETFLEVGQKAHAFDPRTLGVARYGVITKVGRKYATVDFGLTGTARVLHRDILETRASWDSF